MNSKEQKRTFSSPWRGLPHVFFLNPAGFGGVLLGLIKK